MDETTKLDPLVALKEIVAAWESLPGGRTYTASQVEQWLTNQMKPAIDNAREVVAQLSEKEVI